MRVQLTDGTQLSDLCAWLSARGWRVASDDEAHAEILIPWEQDEFFAALFLRAEIAAWQAKHTSIRVLVDPEMWTASAGTVTAATPRSGSAP